MICARDSYVEHNSKIISEIVLKRQKSNKSNIIYILISISFYIIYILIPVSF
jgi:hypothetical protein